MKKILFWLSVVLCSLCVQELAAQEIIPGKPISGPDEAGYLLQRIPLAGSSAKIRLVHVESTPVAQLPPGRTAGVSFDPDIFYGVERKKSYATLRIPMFRRSGSGFEQLTGYDIAIEPAEQSVDGSAAKPTAVSHSVLATGHWYKIAVPKRGIYKIDYSWLQSHGINPAQINPQHIRLYGNGGTVLPEVVSDDQPDDLIENAIYVSASGSSFGSNDYILFYANGPVLWEKDALHDRFTHTNNYYEDQSYYFLNFDLGAGLRVPTVPATGNADHTFTDFDDYRVVDIDSINIGSAGKVWWYYPMDANNPSSLKASFTMDLGGLAGPVHAVVHVGNRNDASGNQVIMKVNGEEVESFSLGAVSDDYSLRDETKGFTFSPGSKNLNVEFQYLPVGNGVAYVDYVRLNYKRPLTFGQGQMNFRNIISTNLGSGGMAGYSLAGVPSQIKIWDVTDPLHPEALSGQMGNASYLIVRPANELREFVAFDGTQFYTPSFVGTVPNQDLHALEQPDLIIVTNATLKPAADRLADFHRSQGTATVVALKKEIYNEFSSGGQDIGGIRNFIKMFYDRAQSEAEMPENVLLFGAASYDYKNRIANNTNIVPVYQTLESARKGGAYSSDDYYGLLDPGESISAVSGYLDVGLGRIPAYNLEEAQAVVSKILHYASPASFGPWKNVVSFVADDAEPGMHHLLDCERVNEFFVDSVRQFSLFKIYSDAYPKVVTSGGARYPAVNKAINDQIFNGTFLMSYSGHGSPERWSHEAILTPDDYGNWTNKNKLPLMITATCDFGRFDNPAVRSAGARLMMNPDGGSVAIVTTTQEVYPSGSTELNREFIRNQFTREADGRWPTLGQSLTKAKNYASGAGHNNFKYVILGDPALRLQMPRHRVVTNSLSPETASGVPTDTIRALGKYILKGSVVDDQEQTLSDFNGIVYVTIFDKPRVVPTVNPSPYAPPNFVLQTSIVARVKADVQNGQFSARFIVPKDINYDLGKGKISYYANSSETDAAGVDTNVLVGGYNADAAPDNLAPVVEPFIDDERFRDGGVTGPNPMLYVKLFDDNGINVTGSSLGHDLVAILDGDIQNPMVMNSYYQTEENDYQHGYVYFPLYNLPDGEHTIRVKAWDTYNNSGEGTVRFVVRNKDKGFISDLYNYPNPVYDITHFVFQHNQAGEHLDISLQIFNPAGALVWQIHKQMVATGNRTEMVWDGQGADNQPLAKGVYFYRLTIKTKKGISATAYQKLVLLR